MTKHHAIHFIVPILLIVLTLDNAHGDQVRVRSGIAIDSSLAVPELRVLSVNDGPQDVYELKIVMETPWKTSETLVRPVWDVNEENRVLFNVRPDPGSKGRYPVIVKLMFRDRAGIPMTVFEVSTFAIGHNDQPDIRLSSNGSRLYLSDDLEVKLVNAGKEDLTVNCRLVHPPSIAVERETIETQLKASSSITPAFHITNRYAVIGNVVPVHIVAEYQKAGVHDTVLAKTEITVVSYREAYPWVRGMLWILLVLSGVAALRLFYHQTP
jgi:hypothetical protein